MKIIDFEVTGLVVLLDDDAQTPKHVGDAHQMYVYMYVCSMYCAFSWY